MSIHGDIIWLFQLSFEVFSCLGFGYPFKPNLGLNIVPLGFTYEMPHQYNLFELLPSECILGVTNIWYVNAYDVMLKF